MTFRCDFKSVEPLRSIRELPWNVILVVRFTVVAIEVVFLGSPDELTLD